MSNNELPIGFFDSGVGGLSVYSKFRKVLPSENTIYFGDLKNMPYGSKSKEELIGFAKNILNFFESKHVKAVVIACNTSSAMAYEHIKDNYSFKIYPIIQSCAKVISSLPINTLGVFATPATIKSCAYSKEIHKYNPNIKIEELACPDWTSIVENGGVNTSEKYENVKAIVLNMLKFNPDKIILGCTHYPYLLSTLCDFVPEDTFIDPSKIFVDYIKTDLESSGMLNSETKSGNESFFVSASPDNFAKNAELFYKLKELPSLISIDKPISLKL